MAGLLDFHKARFAVQGATLVVTAVPALEEALRDGAKATLLQDTVPSVLGPEADWKTAPAAPQAREDAPAPAVSAPAAGAPAPDRGTAPSRQPGQQQLDTQPPGDEARTTAEKDPTVRAVLELFGGRVVDVRPRTH